MRAAVFALLLVIAACEDGDVTGPLVEKPPPGAEPNAGCAKECHGTAETNAPPLGIGGTSETTDVGVGAHRAHLAPAPTWHRRVDCTDCHVVPMRDDDPGHIDGDDMAEVTFSDIAGGATSTWNGTTCTARCHGQTAWGGTHTTPTWTQVDGTQATCGSCHGTPPPPPHPAVQNNNCAECHPTMEESSLTFRDPDSHINGTIDLSDPTATGGCAGACHGTAGVNAAPPRDISGDTTRDAAGVGAHQAHLGVPTFGHRAVVCLDCHKVPTTQASPGHIDGDSIAEVTFGFLNPNATYTAGTTTCSNLYCHGNGRGGNGTRDWLSTSPQQCGDCHRVDGENMSGRHERHADRDILCADCHATVVDAGMGIIGANLHINGVHEVKMAQGTWNPNTRQCSNVGCHNTRSWN